MWAAAEKAGLIVMSLWFDVNDWFAFTKSFLELVVEWYFEEISVLIIVRDICELVGKFMHG